MENTIASRATVAPESPSPWHDATVAGETTVAPAATLAQYAVVKGELRVPNTINYSLFPTLDPFAKAVYYQPFLLSYGFKKHTCIVGLAKLARSVLMSQRKLQETITYLENRGLIKRIESILGGKTRGNVYRVFVPTMDTAPGTTVAPDAAVAQDAKVVCGATVAPDSTAARNAT